MSRPVPEHGTDGRYKRGCRCGACTKAATRADAERTLDRLAGRPRTVPAGPSSAHVRALLERGLTPWQIGQATGVDPALLRRLAKGQKTVLARTEQKILAIPLDIRAAPDDVPSVGAVRRVRALYALGHFNQTIADEAGVSRDVICSLAAGEREYVTGRVDRSVRLAYDRLSMKPGGPSKTRRLAERNGWAPPLAWDDDTIDDPQAEPQLDAVAPVVTEGGNVAARWLMGESVILGADDRREVLAYLYQWTDLTTAEIAARLEMTPDAADQTWSRIKRKARLAGGPVPWRRVYVPRTLKQNEMGEAA